MHAPVDDVTATVVVVVVVVGTVAAEAVEGAGAVR